MSISTYTRLVTGLTSLGLTVNNTATDSKCRQMVLEFVTTRQYDPHWLEACTNILGKESKLLWIFHPWETSWLVEADTRAITLTVFNYAQLHYNSHLIETLVHLVGLGLEPPPAPSSNFIPTPSLLFYVYPDLRELDMTFRSYLSDAYHDDLLRPKSCSEVLTPLGLCCRQHRLVTAQKARFLGWYLYHHFDPHPTTKLSAPPHMPHPPSADEIRNQVESHLPIPPDPATFLRAYFTFRAYEDQHLLSLPTPECPVGGYAFHHCCPTHLATLAIDSLFRTQAAFYERRHAITLMESRRHRTPPGFLSQAWIEILMHIEKVKWQSLPLPSGYTPKSRESLLYDHYLTN